MELWKDFQASTFYMIDRNTGSQYNCDKFGVAPSTFKPYETGFNSQRTTYNLEADATYRVQPKKFDGYFQCPRPSSHITEVRRPYTSNTKHYLPKRLSDDVTKLPRPVASLSFSKVYNLEGSPVIPTHRPKPSYPDVPKLTIEDVKKTLLTSPPKEVKTAQELLVKNQKEKETMKGNKVRKPKQERRKMKGFFMIEFKTSHDLFRKEKKVWEKTNPVAIEKLRKTEAAEYKNLERRREQKILKNRLIEQGLKII